MDKQELARFMIELLDETFGPRPVEIGKRWHGGSLILRPGNDSQEKDIPLDVFFKKLLTVRDALRVLEQKLNSHDALSTEDKATFHGYISRAYGTLTTFNILFKEDKDRFVGQGSGGGGGKEEKDANPAMTMGEARAKLGLKEYGNE